MLPSRRPFALVLSLCFVVPAFGQTSAPANPAPQQQPAQAAAGGQIPVQDLTPPSDFEIEKAAAEAQKKADEEAAAMASRNPNQGTGATQVPGQAPPKTSSGEYVFRQQVEEVMLYATVVDPRNRIVTNLDRNSFTVFEDNVPQKITSFRRQDIPVSLGILIDNSGSMRIKRPAVNQAALNLVRSSNPQDEVFVVNFTDSDHIYRDQDFTSDINLLKEALEKVESRGATAIYDTVIASADYLEKGAKHDKKILLVITDGEDNASVKTLEQAVSAVQRENGPTVYTIGILDKDKAAKRARRALERLSLETGGIAFFPSDLSEVDEISRQIAHDIRSQYAIGYKPVRPQSEGGFRNVRVEARAGKDKLIVRTKSGYFAGQRQQAAKGTSGGK